MLSIRHRALWGTAPGTPAGGPGVSQLALLEVADSLAYVGQHSNLFSYNPVHEYLFYQADLL